MQNLLSLTGESECKNDAKSARIKKITKTLDKKIKACYMEKSFEETWGKLDWKDASDEKLAQLVAEMRQLSHDN